MSQSPTRRGRRDEAHGKSLRGAGDERDGVARLLILILALTSTACLRLTPSERSTDEPSPTSTAQDTTSNSSDTTAIGTDHPCDDVPCLDRPDSRRCADGVLTVAAGDGYCAMDTSSAPRCGFHTEQMKCLSGSCEDTAHCEDAPCYGVRCDLPPPNECLVGTDEDSDGSHRLLIYEREGRCQLGTDSETACVYDTAIIDCKNACDTDTVFGAHCLDEPCRGVVCNQPPARYCADASTLVVWNLFGRCKDDGSCLYNKRTLDCPLDEGGCENGRCTGNLCAGMLCYRPPARYCSSAAAVSDFNPVGTCDAAGACVYEKMQRDCLDSDCAGGNCGSQACVDGSLCHTPPAPYCNAEGRLVFWDNLPPDCDSDDHCAYSTSQPPCDSGSCVNGGCDGDACAGPTWPCINGAPARYCLDKDVAVTSSFRECQKSSLCVYDTATESCPGGCQAGVCEQTSPVSPMPAIVR